METTKVRYTLKQFRDMEETIALIFKVREDRKSLSKNKSYK